MIADKAASIATLRRDSFRHADRRNATRLCANYAACRALASEDGVVDVQRSHEDVLGAGHDCLALKMKVDPIRSRVLIHCVCGNGIGPVVVHF